MNTIFLVFITLLGVANAALLLIYLRRKSGGDPESLRPMFDALLADNRRLDQGMRDEFGRQREEMARSALGLREEVANRIAGGLEQLLQRQSDAQRNTETKLEAFRGTLESQLRTFGDASDGRLTRLRQELNESAGQARNETRQGLVEFQATVRQGMTEAGAAQAAHLTEFGTRLDRMNETIARQLEQIRQTVEGKLGELQTRNEQKLEEMRKTVDEKLEGTLEKRLGDTFKLVSERLEAVHKGLGEMQVMANSVGDLKRVLTNVKTRGTWGEIQLGALLEQILTPEQYAANVAPKPDSAQRVEYAIKLPGRGDGDAPVWLAVDAKFPQEDYQRLLDATERADTDAVAEAGKALEVRLRAQAKDISDKYIAPPHTTDFAIMFLPSEGLYAEALRRPGLAEGLQRDARVMIAGPTTLAAILNSLQMGFRTLAIQQRSSEVWKVLGAVKSEFGKFGDVLAKVKTKLEQATNEISNTEVRSRAITRTLRSVEALPSTAAAGILPTLPGPDTEIDGAEDGLPLLQSIRPSSLLDK